MSELNGDRSAWLRCYRCWSQNLEIQIHYDAIRRVDPETGVPAEGVDEVQEAVVQCLDCMHDQPHLTFQDDRVVPIEDRWERMVAGTPWVASCTVTRRPGPGRELLGPRSGRVPHLRRLRRRRRARVLHPRPLPQARRGAGSSSTCWSSSTPARPRRRPTCSKRPPRASSRSPRWRRSHAPRPTPQTKRTNYSTSPSASGPRPGSCGGRAPGA